MNKFKLTQTELKIFACSLMLVDHIGLIFFPKLLIFRMIGRLSFPVFAWFFAKGYERTRNYQSYLLRLLGFGCLSQPLYSLMLNQSLFGSFNILISFAYNLMLFRVAHGYRQKKPLILIAGMLIESWLKLDYGWYGTAIILLMLSRLENTWKEKSFYPIWLTSWWTINIASFSISWYQPIAGLSSLIIDSADSENEKKPNLFKKLGFYVFYPAHIAGLLLVKGML